LFFFPAIDQYHNTRGIHVKFSNTRTGEHIPGSITFNNRFDTGPIHPPSLDPGNEFIKKLKGKIPAEHFMLWSQCGKYTSVSKF